MPFIKMTIYQPRAGGAKTWETDTAWLQSLVEDARAAVARSEEARTFFGPNTVTKLFSPEEWQAQYLNPTEKGCEWCKRRGDCPALAGVMLSHALEPVSLDGMDGDLVTLPAPDFEEGIENAIRSVPTLDFETLLKIYKVSDRLSEWLKAVGERVFSEFKQGIEHPDFKLVKAERGHRKWATDSGILAFAALENVDTGILYDKSLVSPAEAERRLKKALPKGRFKEIKDEFDALITRPEGVLTLVPSYDSRPAVTLAPPEADMPDHSFEDVL